MLLPGCFLGAFSVNTIDEMFSKTFSFPLSFQVVSHNLLPTKVLNESSGFLDPLSLSSAGPLWENPGNSLISDSVNARIVYGGMESPLGMSQHPRRNETQHRKSSEPEAFSHREWQSADQCVWQGLKTTAYALYIINEHEERSHNEHSAPALCVSV